MNILAGGRQCGTGLVHDQYWENGMSRSFGDRRDCSHEKATHQVAYIVGVISTTRITVNESFE